MKKLLLLAIVALSSCDEPERRWIYQGDITTLRIDDDSEYHFSTDNLVESDVPKYMVHISRKDILKPALYLQSERCPKGKICNTCQEDWQLVQNGDYLIELPKNYKVETFED